MSEDIITNNDYALLLEAGFRSQFADTIVWKDDTDGNHWQASLGEYTSDPVSFISHYPDFRRRPAEMLTRQRFVKLFMGVA
jgi:hypothetical protein